MSVQYQPTFLSPKYVQRYSKFKQPGKGNLTDINGLELDLMKKIKSSPNLNENLVSSVNSHIEYLKKQQHAGVGSESELDISSKNDLKLKGGAKHLKLKKFNSAYSNLNIALNLIRSSNILGQFNYHQKCLQSKGCSFCLLRSCLCKINMQKGRNSVVPVEIEVQKLETSETAVKV